jgi:hypothetical protein
VLRFDVAGAGSKQGFATWLAAWAILALCLLRGAASARAQAPEGRGAGAPSWRIPIVFHVAEREGEAVAPASFISEQLASANLIYRPLGIELVERARVPLAAAHAELVTRAERDALGAFVKHGAVHCFVVGKLMDVDEPGRERRGVHWRPHGRALLGNKAEQSFVIVSRISKPWVLAHELGHFFGNREHSTVPGNLMSYAWTVEPPFLDANQGQRVLRTLRALLKSGRLVQLPAAP